MQKVLNIKCKQSANSVSRTIEMQMNGIILGSHEAVLDVHSWI